MIKVYSQGHFYLRLTFHNLPGIVSNEILLSLISIDHTCSDKMEILKFNEPRLAQSPNVGIVIKVTLRSSDCHIAVKKLKNNILLRKKIKERGLGIKFHSHSCFSHTVGCIIKLYYILA